MAVELTLKVEGVKPRKPHIDFIDLLPVFFQFTLFPMKD